MTLKSYKVSSGAHDIMVVASSLREAVDRFLREVFRRPTAVALGFIIRIEDGVDTWFVTTERVVRERGLLREWRMEGSWSGY